MSLFFTKFHFYLILFILIATFFYQAGFKKGQIDTLKQAYLTYKKQVPWECS